MEEHLHSEGVRCPRQGGGAEYIINVIYYIYLNHISRTYICDMMKKHKKFEKIYIYVLTLKNVYNPHSRSQKLLLRYFYASQNSDVCHVLDSLFCQHDMTRGDKILTTLRCRLSRFLSISVC